MKLLIYVFVACFVLSPVAWSHEARLTEICPDPGTHFCRCEPKGADLYAMIRVDITGGQKFETLLRSYDNEEECNYQITRTQACKTR